MKWLIFNNFVDYKQSSQNFVNNVLGIDWQGRNITLNEFPKIFNFLVDYNTTAQQKWLDQTKQ